MNKRIHKDELRRMIPRPYYNMYDFWAASPYSIEQLRQKNRKRHVSTWRQIGMCWAIMSGYGTVEAGQHFHRDHATVVHACRTIVMVFQIPGYEDVMDLIKSIKQNLAYSAASDSLQENMQLMEVILRQKHPEIFLEKK